MCMIVYLSRSAVREKEMNKEHNHVSKNTETVFGQQFEAVDDRLMQENGSVFYFIIKFCELLSIRNVLEDI